MSILIKGMDMPVTCCHCPLMGYDPDREWNDGMARMGAHICVLTGELINNTKRDDHCPLFPVPTHGRLRRRIVYRGEVYNALESARINALDGILTDRYKDGFHDGLKKALEILANEVQDAPTIIPAED